jgi:energy-coupling factor transporter ATP-binding protein EcfA2
MKVLLFGNVGSGKTTLIKKLKEIFSFEAITIDDYRRKYGDGTKEGEVLAKEFFLQSVTPHKNQFIECIGVGQLADDLYELLSHTNEMIICLTVIAPKEVCKSRLESRVWDIPFPEPVEKVSILLEKTELRIKDGLIEQKWERLKNIAFIQKNNISPCHTDMIVEEVSLLIKEAMEDYELMLKSDVQSYYGNEYLTYQKNVIQRNEKFLQDQLLISKFIEGLNVTGNIVDIGAGDCQWFPTLEKSINRYYAIETNVNALNLAPQNEKLIPINRDIFDDEFDLKNITTEKIDYAIFSFLLSHFSDNTIYRLLKKLQPINSLIIIDSFWTNDHRKKYITKDLKNINRKLPDKEIQLPKRFFEVSDLERIAKKSGFTITNFKYGNYWFVCELKGYKKQDEQEIKQA